MTKAPGKTQTLVNKRHPEGLVYRPSQEGLLPCTIAPSHLARGITTFVLVLILIYSLLPIYWVVISVTKSNSELTISFDLWFAEYGKSSESRSLFGAIGSDYEKLTSWARGNFWCWVSNSLIYSTVPAAIDTLILVMARYVLARFVFFDKNIVTGVIMTGLLMFAALLTVPLYIVLLHLGVSNTMASIIMPCCVSPFGMFLGRAYSQTSVSAGLIEAAGTDGASEARIFFTMAFRISAPATVAILLFISAACWDNFLLPLVILSDEILKPVTLGLYGMMSYLSPEKGAVMMGALFEVIPLIILSLGLQKYWQSGLATGSVKG